MYAIVKKVTMYAPAPSGDLLFVLLELSELYQKPGVLLFGRSLTHVPS